MFYEFLSFWIAPGALDVEPVGRWFRAWWWHHHRNGALSEGVSFAESADRSDEDEESVDVEIEDDVDYLRSLDPKEWKVSSLSFLSSFKFRITAAYSFL